MKNILLFSLLMMSCVQLSYSQTDITNDTVCIVPGEPFMYNVTTNDLLCQNPPQCFVMLGDQTTCFELSPTGDFHFTGSIPDCCGHYVLRYGYPIFPAYSDLSTSRSNARNLIAVLLNWNHRREAPVDPHPKSPSMLVKTAPPPITLIIPSAIRIPGWSPEEHML